MDEEKVKNEKTLDTIVEPNKKLLYISNRYLNDIECINEMIVTVLPILKEKDEVRTQQVKEALKILNNSLKRVKNSQQNEKSKNNTFKLPELNYDSLISNIVKLSRADQLFRKQCIVSFISRFDEFIGGFLEIMFKKNPDWLIKSNEKTITYKELIDLDSIEKAIEGVIIKEVDNILRLSHKNQIDEIDQKLKLGINDSCKHLINFYEVTERRNLFVHTGGVVSNSYINNCKRMGITLPEDLEMGKYLQADDSYLSQAFQVCFELGLKISQSGYRRLFPDFLEEADKGLNHLAIRFLNNGDFELAKLICDYDINLPAKFRSSDGEMYYYALINRAIAIKFLGEDFEQGLKEICWDAFHPKYKICLHVLRDEFDEAAILMKNEDVIEKITKIGFRTWPVFREFRGSTQFVQAYKEIFKEDFIVDPEENVLNMNLDD